MTMDKLKAYILPLGAGFGVACFALLISFLLSSSSTAKSKSNRNKAVPITYLAFGNSESLLSTMMALFNYEQPDAAQAGNDELLSLADNLSVKIVAQASVGNITKTLLEVTNTKETKRLMVQEGIFVGDLLIKKITNKVLIVEKDATEHTIKLFHPKELNSTKVEQKNDIQ